MSKKITLGILTGVLAVAVSVGALAHAGTPSKSVTIAVDGKAQAVSTSEDTVAAVLTSRGIKLGPHDAVAPALSTPIHDGTRIAVSYGRELTLVVDGNEQTYWTTATTVSSALDQIGTRIESGADLSTSRSAFISRQGLALKINTPKQVVVKVGPNAKQLVTTTGLTVGEALIGMHVRLDHNDVVLPSIRTTITDGSKIIVTRVFSGLRTVTLPVSYQTTVRNDSSLPQGTVKVVQAGKAGKEQVTYRVLGTNGKLDSKRVVKRVVTDRKSVV